jgi:hypothetical protein
MKWGSIIPPIAVIGLILIGQSRESYSQQVPPEPHRHPGNFAKVEQMVDDISSEQSASAEEKVRSFGYIMANLKWPQNTPITICFLQPAVPNETSSPETINRIVGLMQQWVQPGFANLKLDFGSPDSWRRCSPGVASDIRIGFDPNSSNGPRWSIVGHDLGAAADQPTANFYFDHNMLAAASNSSLGYYFRYTILHETGHALGFIHEHQGGNCDGEFNFQKLYQYYGWTEKMINDNFRHLSDPKVAELTPYCRGSVMNYVVDPAYYIKGAASICYTPPVSQLAECDQKTAAVAYPGSAASQILGAGQVHSMIATAMGDEPTSTDQRRLLVRAARDVAEKAALPDHIINNLKQASDATDLQNSNELQNTQLALGQIVSQSAVAGGGSALAPNMTLAPPSVTEQKAILKITEALRPDIP